MSTARARPVRPLPAARRVHAALVLWAFTVHNLAGLIHEGTTVHARCAEHGELIHAARSSAAAPAVVDDLTGGVRHAPPEASDGDNHCFIGCAMGERATVARTVVGDALARSALTVESHLGCDGRAAAPLALPLRAPKTSPPA